MNDITISDVQIVPVKPSNGLVAFVSFIINGCVYVGDVGIHTSLSNSGGYRLVYPDKVLRTGKRINCVHPVTKEAGDLITGAVLEKFKKVVGDVF